MRRLLDVVFAGALAWVTLVVACGGVDVKVAGLAISSRKVIVPGMLVWLLAIATGLARWRQARTPLPEGGGGPSFAVAWALSAGLVALTLHRAVGRPFMMDDLMMVRSARGLTPEIFANMWRGVGWSTLGFVRPIPELMWWLEWKLHACTPLYCHLANLALHLVNVALVGLVARRIVPGGRLAPFAMLLFAVTGTHAEPLLWLSSRYDLLATTFGLAAIAAFVRWLDEAGTPSLAAALACALAAIFCKESALGLPIGLAGLAGLRGRWRAGLAPLAVLAGALVYRVIMIRPDGAGEQVHWVAVDKLLLTPLSPLAPLAWPANMEQAADLAWPARALIAGLLALAPLAAVRRAQCGPDGATLAACGLLVAATAPAHAVLSLAVTLKQSRYLYLPAALYAVFVVELARAVPARHAVLGLTLVVAANAALLRCNAEPFAASGAVVSRVLAQSAPVVDALRAGHVVEVRGLPLAWRGAPMCQGYTILIPLVEAAGVSQERLYLARDAWRDAPARVDRAFRWDPTSGFAAEPP